MSKKNFIKGTLILTLGGIIARALGFLIRILLINYTGTEELGLFQLILPVCGICYALAISGYEISITRYVSYYKGKNNTGKGSAIALFCFKSSFLISVLLCIGLHLLAPLIAQKTLHTGSGALLLRIAVWSTPLSCIHCAVSAYYLGEDKPLTMVLLQISEQLIRIIAIVLLGKILHTALLCVISLLIGEIGASMLCIFTLFFAKSFNPDPKQKIKRREITKTSFAISSNRVCLHAIQCIEAPLIPMMLSMYGLTRSEALSLYGIITGMVFPVIMLGSTLAGSVAQMLIPSVSKIRHNRDRLKKSTESAFCFSMLFGIFCIIMLLFTANFIGNSIFHTPSACRYIKSICFICPLLYINTTYKSILHALGLTGRVFANSMLSELIVIVSVVFGIPKHGIGAYWAGMMIAQAVYAVFNIILLTKYIKKIK